MFGGPVVHFWWRIFSECQHNICFSGAWATACIAHTIHRIQIILRITHNFLAFVQIIRLCFVLYTKVYIIVHTCSFYTQCRNMFKENTSLVCLSVGHCHPAVSWLGLEIMDFNRDKNLELFMLWCAQCWSKIFRRWKYQNSILMGFSFRLKFS